MGISQVLMGFAGVTAGIAVIGNLPISWFMSAEKATLKYLESGYVQTIEKNPRKFSASIYSI
jgi:hypothetical protein